MRATLAGSPPTKTSGTRRVFLLWRRAQAISRPCEGRRVRSITIAAGGSSFDARSAAGASTSYSTRSPAARNSCARARPSDSFQWTSWMRATRRRSVAVAVDAAGVVGLVEPGVEQLEPVLDLAVRGRGAVGEERPVAGVLAALLVRERRVPLEVAPASLLVHRQHDEHAV